MTEEEMTMEEEKALEVAPEEAGELFDGGWDNETIDDEPADAEAEEALEAAGEAEEAEEEAESLPEMPDFSGFIREHPSLSAEDIPDEVWEAVARGDGLAEAWTRHENSLLKRRLLELEQREINRSRSTGSRKTGGRAKPYDPFEDGWTNL